MSHGFNFNFAYKIANLLSEWENSNNTRVRPQGGCYNLEGLGRI